MRAKLPYAFASVLIGAVAALSAPADAACKKFGFTVNDYGKDGPTNDAKNLLDKHIAEWAAQNKITEFQTGKKSVSCELFLDVVLFDEHTCTASATVCWGADAKKLGAQSAAAPADGAAGTPPAPVRKAHASGHTPKQAATAAATPAATAAPAEAAAPAESAGTESTTPAAAEAPQFDAAPAQAVEQITAPSETPTAAPAVHTTAAPASPAQPPAAAPAPNAGGTTGAVVDTGALPAEQTVPPQTQKRATTAVPEKDRAAAASAAASAAAAAERAAVAAETAANAAKEAAAAAVAASAASKGAKPVHNE